MKWNGSRWVALDDTASQVALQHGGMLVTGNTGLSGGNPFVPKVLFEIQPDGDVIVKDGNLWVDGVLVQQSDRELKENFEALEPEEVLEKVNLLPVSQWNFKKDDKSIKHIGPMAQDFYSAFGLGETDKMIAPLDVNGVTLAAIQGLNQKLEKTVEQQQQQIEQLTKQVEVLLEKMSNYQYG